MDQSSATTSSPPEQSRTVDEIVQDTRRELLQTGGLPLGKKTNPPVKPEELKINGTMGDR